MDIYGFMSNSPYLTFFLAYIIVNLLLKSWLIFWRHWNIKKHGWPPRWCDADGDSKEMTKDRKDVAEFIKNQFSDNEELYKCAREKGLQYHYGRQEIRELMDFIYSGLPVSSDEKITKQ